MSRPRPLFLLVLTLGWLTVGTAWAQKTGSVTVRRGDTLWGIAQRYGTTVGALRQANGIAGSRLTPGTKVRLPEGQPATPDLYVVQPGDTLYTIALAFRLSVDDLIAYNHLDGSVIRPGQQLRLHASTPAPAPLVVTVRPADTLWSLARDHNVSVKALEGANGLGPGSVIHPGERLTVPGRYASPTTDTGGPVPPTVTVTKGDTLWSIAHRYHTSVAALMSANDLPSNALLAGQTLRIVPPGQLGAARVPSKDPSPTPTTSMVWPIRGAITSRFGYRQLRVDGSNFHTGLDIAGNLGEPIRAAVGGTVVLAGWNGGYGLCVIVRHGSTTYYYGHASVLLVKRGQAVKEGQIIAQVGDTGHSTGPHLHFEIRVDDQPVDPLPLLRVRASG